MIVVDVGCYTHPGYPEDESTRKLIGRFEPDLYVGFDPHPDLVERNEWVGRTDAAFRCEAAWVTDGKVPYDRRPDRPLAASVGAGPLMVDCFDLAEAVSILRGAGVHPPPLIVKIDAEGAEYQLLEHLLATGTAGLVDRLLVEWHRPPIGPPDWEARRGRILAELPCEVEAW